MEHKKNKQVTHGQPLPEPPEQEMAETLLPCPFCGGAASIGMYTRRIGNTYSVFCTQCGAESFDLFPDKEQATEAWNRRHKETNVYDQEEIFEDCTVQILTNSVTGETSVGWWKNE